MSFDTKEESENRIGLLLQDGPLAFEDRSINTSIPSSPFSSTMSCSNSPRHKTVRSDDTSSVEATKQEQWKPLPYNELTRKVMDRLDSFLLASIGGQQRNEFSHAGKESNLATHFEPENVDESLVASDHHLRSQVEGNHLRSQIEGNHLRSQIEEPRGESVAGSEEEKGEVDENVEQYASLEQQYSQALFQKSILFLKFKEMCTKVQRIQTQLLTQIKDPDTYGFVIPGRFNTSQFEQPIVRVRYHSRYEKLSSKKSFREKMMIAMQTTLGPFLSSQMGWSPEECDKNMTRISYELVDSVYDQRSRTVVPELTILNGSVISRKRKITPIEFSMGGIPEEEDDLCPVVVTKKRCIENEER